MNVSLILAGRETGAGVDFGVAVGVGVPVAVAVGDGVGVTLGLATEDVGDGCADGEISFTGDGVLLGVADFSGPVGVGVGDLRGPVAEDFDFGFGVGVRLGAGV